jgi:hypothetical protein
LILPADTPRAVLRAVIFHELAHVRHRDAAWLGAVALVRALYWFNPAIWALSRNHRVTIERLSDEDASVALGDRHGYARALVSMAQAGARWRLSAGLAMSQTGIAARVRALLQRSARLPAVSKAMRTFVIASSVSLGALGLGANLFALPLRDSANAEEAIIYVHVGQGIWLDAPAIGAGCWNDAHCWFGVPRGSRVRFIARPESASPLVWRGCEVAADGRSCLVGTTSSDATLSVEAE